MDFLLIASYLASPLFYYSYFKCGWTINKYGPKNLLKHIFYNHTENATSDYLCEMCGKYFFQSLDLLKHSREEHGDGSNIGKSNF